MTGDWNGNGVTGIGVVRPKARQESPTTLWRLRQTASAGAADRTFYFGQGNVHYVVGDWNQRGPERPGLVRRRGKWRFRGVRSNGMSFGGARTIPVVWQSSDWTPGRLPQ